MTTTPLTDQQLRDHVAEAIASVTVTIGPNSLALLKDGHTLGLSGGEIDAMALSALAVMQPELDRLAAELGRVRAELTTAREREEQLAELLRAGQHWKGTRLVAESRYSAREIRALFSWPEPTPPASPSA